MSQVQRPAGATRTPSPFRVNLEQQRKRAKEFLASLCAGDAAAEARFRSYHPRSSAWNKEVPQEVLTLGDAQLVLAREIGFPSWPRLKDHVTVLDRIGRTSPRAVQRPTQDVARPCTSAAASIFGQACGTSASAAISSSTPILSSMVLLPMDRVGLTGAPPFLRMSTGRGSVRSVRRSSTASQKRSGGSKRPRLITIVSCSGSSTTTTTS